MCQKNRVSTKLLTLEQEIKTTHLVMIFWSDRLCRNKPNCAKFCVGFIFVQSINSYAPQICAKLSGMMTNCAKLHLKS